MAKRNEVRTRRRSRAVVSGGFVLLLVAQACGDGDTAPTAVDSDVTTATTDATVDAEVDDATTGETATTSAATADSADEVTASDAPPGTSTTDADAGTACSIVSRPFEHRLIDDEGPVDVWQKIVGDLDGDGRDDLIAGGQAGGGLFWYQNPDWVRHEIAPGGGHGTDGEVADVDGDGDLDVVSLTRSGMVWYDNPEWAPTEIDSRTLHDVEVADLDGDGDVDAVARNQGEFGGPGDELHFYTQESPTVWTHRAVSIPDGEGLLVADVDGDGDGDVVIGGHWYENTGDIAGGPWAGHAYTTSWAHPNAYVAAADVDGDGRLDVVLAPSELAGQTGYIAWYAAPSDPTTGEWTEHVIEADVEAVHHFVGAADVDGDGDVDVAAAEMQQGADPDEVKIYVNGGDGESWTKVVVATSGSHSMRIVDANGDGAPDLFGANHRGTNVDLWLNPGCG